METPNTYESYETLQLCAAEVEGRGAIVVGQQGPPTAAPSRQRAESSGHRSRTTEVLLALGAGLIL